MERKVGIIGAGPSGLLACKYALSKGFSPVVFEAKSSIGGVWTKTLETTKLQSPRMMYQFSDFPWPDSVTELYPAQKEVIDYLQSYALHFNLLQHIKFNSKVLSLRYEGASEEEMQAWSLWGGTGEPFGTKGKWNVTIQDTQSLSVEEYQFDFVILCVGRFGDVPNMPSFPAGKGPEVFKGKAMHCVDFFEMNTASAQEMVKGKRVVVVGLGKTGMEIAMFCAHVNGAQTPCTVIFRNAHWALDDGHVFGISLGHLYFNRFSELLLHKPQQGYLLTALATLLSPLRWAIAKLVEKEKGRILAKYGILPRQSFHKEMSAGLLAAIPEGFFDRVDEGSIKFIRTNSFSFFDGGLHLIGDDNNKAAAETMEADVVIFCTGYTGIGKFKDIFESSYFRKCMNRLSDTTIPLYRDCIIPQIPQLAVNGWSQSGSNLFTSEMRSRWLAELLDGKFKLPSIKDMETSIVEWHNYMKRYLGEYYDKTSIGTLHIWYNDQLCKDMGWNPKRKKSFFSEMFEPYGPWDYIHP